MLFFFSDSLVQFSCIGGALDLEFMKHSCLGLGFIEQEREF